MDPKFQDPEWAKAATLAERLAVPLPQHAGADSLSPENAKLAQSRLERWRSQPAFSAGGLFSRRLASDGLSDQDLFYLLGEPSEALQSRLGSKPPWLLKLEHAFSRPRSQKPLPISGDERKLKESAFLDAIEPLIRLALDEVEDGARRISWAGQEPLFDSLTVADLLFDGMPRQLLFLMTRTMVLELNIARLEGSLSGETPEARFGSFLERLRNRDAVIEILRLYPVLARQIVTRLDLWVEGSLELLQRLRADGKDLRSAFVEGASVGRLAEVRGSEGDRHGGGRCVKILTFQTGVKIVYKPRPLAVGVRFQELLAWLNRQGIQPPFNLLRILDRGRYGWVEFVGTRDCGTEEEVRRFYERQGGFLALLYVLEATDFHFENVLAAGEHPVLVDLETLMQPQVVSDEPLTTRMMRESVLRTGLLPTRMGGDAEREGLEISGLGGADGQMTPHPLPGFVEEGTDRMHLVRRHVEMAGASNRPRLQGSVVEVSRYLDSIAQGFSGCYRFLLEHQRELLEPGSPISRFRASDTRFIARPSQSYGLMLQESYHPQLLRDALIQDRHWDNLWFLAQQRLYLERLIPYERNDLGRGDIPLFFSRPGSRDLWSSSGEAIPGFFRQAGLDLVRKRVASLSEDDLDRQLWFVRTSVRLHAPDLMEEEPYSPDGSAGTVEPSRLIALARRAGDRLERLATRRGEEVCWAGITSSHGQNWQIQPMGIDLYGGLSGIALFLAYLGAITGEDRYRELARDSWSTARLRLESADLEFPSIGGFGGWGGLVYTLTHLGALWGEADLLQEGERFAERLRPLIAKDDRLDVIGGAAGCIAGLLSLHRVASSTSALDTAVQCGDHLLRQRLRMEKGVAWDTKADSTQPLSGFAHGAAGISWALLELAAASGEARFRKAALEAMVYERTLFVREFGNWRDLRKLTAAGMAVQAGEHVFMHAWCHGAPGIGASRLRALAHFDDPAIRDEIEVAFSTTLRSGFGSNFSLCHGDLGNLDLLLEMRGALDGGEAAGKTDGIAGRILTRIERHGWLCGTPGSIETPALLTGVAGIGYGLLRLACPMKVPSVLLLDPPSSSLIKMR